MIKMLPILPIRLYLSAISTKYENYETVDYIVHLHNPQKSNPLKLKGSNSQFKITLLKCLYIILKKGVFIINIHVIDMALCSRIFRIFLVGWNNGMFSGHASHIHINLMVLNWELLVVYLPCAVGAQKAL